MSEGARSGIAGPTDARRVLYWIYAGRLTVGTVTFGVASVIGGDWGFLPEQLGQARVGMLALWTLAVLGVGTGFSYWSSHRRGAEPTIRFVVYQAAIDLILVTVVVLLTGGSTSVLPPLLYIALVSGYALITPLVVGLLIAAVASASYLGAVAFAYPEQLGIGVLLQVLIFTLVALVSGLIGGRLREMGRQLSSLERELNRLRFGTADILRTIDAAVVTVDDEGRAVYLNPAAADLFGLDPQAWIGNPVMEVLGKRAPGVGEALRDTLHLHGSVKARDVEIDTPAAGDVPYSVSTALLEREGAPTLATAVLQDLRMARQLEELHLRASRLAVVAELSASLAHEIKNPLASIRSAVEQIADPTSDAGDRAALSQLVVREADRLSRLLGEFNDFARVDVAARLPIDLDRVIGEAVAMVAQRPESKDRATFEVDVAPGLDDLWGDPDLVHRTLTNLILNAVQVSDPNESVTVRVVADALRPGSTPVAMASGMPVRIRVIDDGPGIRPEDVARVFDPFYTRRRGGSGMGLAIAHRAVQAHGGALLVRSEPGEGATFVVILPRREPETRKVFREAGAEEQAAEMAARYPDFTSARAPDDAAPLDGFADRLG